MQENLVGYLLDALDADEHDTVKRQIENNPKLRRELSTLEARLAPLESERWQDIEPPAHLAASTCSFVAEIAADSAAIEAHPITPRSQMSGAFEPPRKGANWSLTDMVVTAGIFAAISCLFLPSISRSLYSAKIVACQDNLRGLYAGLDKYSAANKGDYPTPQLRGNVVMAGSFAPQLVEGNLATYQQMVCPAHQDKRTVTLRIPTVSELQQQKYKPEILASLHKVYGYNLGYVEDGKYHRPRSRSRNHVALVADHFTPFGPANSGHGRRGLNVLMEDGSVKTLPPGVHTIGSDNIFLNDEGCFAPGVHENDSVIGESVQRITLSFLNLPPGTKVKVQFRAGQKTPPATATPKVMDSLPTTEL